MASLGMDGPYALTHEVINAKVTRLSAGNYALSRSAEGTFIVNYVGRSDSDVNAA